MKNNVKKEVEELIKEYNLNCSVEEFGDKIDWEHISKDQKLSEDFIREFQDKVIWSLIFEYQKLSLEFTKEFKNKLNFIPSKRKKWSIIDKKGNKLWRISQ